MKEESETERTKYFSTKTNYYTIEDKFVVIMNFFNKFFEIRNEISGILSQ